MCGSVNNGGGGGGEQVNKCQLSERSWAAVAAGAVS